MPRIALVDGRPSRWGGTGKTHISNTELNVLYQSTPLCNSRFSSTQRMGTLSEVTCVRCRAALRKREGE